MISIPSLTSRQSIDMLALQNNNNIVARQQDNKYHDSRRDSIEQKCEDHNTHRQHDDHHNTHRQHDDHHDEPTIQRLLCEIKRDTLPVREPDMEQEAHGYNNNNDGYNNNNGVTTCKGDDLLHHHTSEESPEDEQVHAPQPKQQHPSPQHPVEQDAAASLVEQGDPSQTPSSDTEETCFICLSPFADRPGQKIAVPCANKCNAAPVHPKCIFEWKERNGNGGAMDASCPLCRGPLGNVKYAPPDVLHSSTFVFKTARRAFIMRPVPREASFVRCYVRVLTTGPWFSRTTSYELWMQGASMLSYPLGPLPRRDRPAPSDIFLLSAKKRLSKFGASRLDISLSRECKLLDQSTTDYIGTVVSSFSGLEHTLVSPFRVSTSQDSESATKLGTHELMSILYGQNRVGLGVGPRKMKVALPSVEEDFEGGLEVEHLVEKEILENGHEPSEYGIRHVDQEAMGEDPDFDNGQRFRFNSSTHRPVKHSETMLALLNAGQPAVEASGALMYLENREPKWLESIQAYSLDFQGRVTHPSNKNFQLMRHGQLVLQFGKIATRAEVGHAIYTLDFQFPISPVQAFAICLSSCDRKLACG